MKTVIDRARKPTPRFFRKLRNIGLIAGTIATGILTAPVALPAALITLAGYVATAAGTAIAVSQLTTRDEEKPVH